MIKINFHEPSTKAWIQWKRDCFAATEKLIGLVRRGEEWDISDKLYKRQKEEYYEAFNGKCGYCEKKIERPYESELDHFRPKKTPTNIDNKGIMVNRCDCTIPHRGYYWLAYDWENLMISCQLCNKPNNQEKKKLGKRNKFPMKDDEYALVPGEEIYEDPLLINPREEYPEKYLKYNFENGHLRAIDDKGQTCIDVFGLNIRDDLVENRQEAYYKVFSLFARYFSIRLTSEKVKVSIELRDIKFGKKPHSIASTAALEDCTEILLLATPSNLQQEIRTILEQ